MTQSWTFLTNHGHVLVQLARNPEQRMRDIAEKVGVTERAVQLIVKDLADGGYITIERVGRRNTYTVSSDRPLRHPAEKQTSIGELIDLIHG